MRSSRICGQVLVTSLFTLGIGLAVIPAASADPANPADPAVAAPAPDGVDTAAADACKQFSGALNYAATNYEDFAYATAGNGNTVNYTDSQVSDSNVVGRTALRESAGVALDASRTPGLTPDIANPMRTWSLNAARLVLIMGLRGGGDSLNSAANDLNSSARNVQLACAAAGTAA